MIMNTLHSERSRRRGVVLLLVLVVTVVLALSAYTFCDLMLSHYEGAKYAGKQTQARMLIDSAVDATRIFLYSTRSDIIDQGGLYDNPAMFQGISAAPNADPAEHGAYTIMAPNINEEGYYEGLRYGLADLSSRLNLNYLVVADSLQEGAGRALLLSVPGMTDELADRILDFIDPDDEARELGAESETYGQMGRSAKNGPLDTVEELLEVDGVTPTMLFGLDVNRNGVIDPHENDISRGDIMDGMELGWAPYITLHSKEANLSADGLPRVFVNEEDLQLLSDELTAAEVPQEWITFILAYRLGRPYTGEDEGESVSNGNFDLSTEPRTTISQVLDLVGSKVQVTFDGDDESTIVNSPAPLDLLALGEQLPIIMDKLTVNPGPDIPGRININQAPLAVLLGIPTMTEDLANMILETRVEAENGDDPNFQFETWLLTRGLLLTTGLDENGEPTGEEPGELDMERMKSLSPYVCARGDVYIAQIVGFFYEGAVSARTEVIFDATSPTMTLLLWRDLSHLGRGFPVDALMPSLGGLGAGGVGGSSMPLTR